MEEVVHKLQWNKSMTNCNGRRSSLEAMEKVVELLLWKE
jgi:hypothetical protein